MPRTRNSPQKISLTQWFHLALEGLWLLNGAVFLVLLFATGQWKRIIPTNWDVVPHAISTAIQYLSSTWPTDNGWVNCNSLQLLSYFLVVFVASPLAAMTGLRMSPVWPRNAGWLSRLCPIEFARALYFPVMLFFVLFSSSLLT